MRPVINNSTPLPLASIATRIFFSSTRDTSICLFKLRRGAGMDNKEGDPLNTNENKKPPPHLSCTKCFDALWFCYSPFHQMQQYYRYGEFDNCFGKWSVLVDCLSLKTKRASEVQEILEEREKSKPHIWTYRTVEEASANWWRMYNRFYKPPSQPDS